MALSIDVEEAFISASKRRMNGSVGRDRFTSTFFTRSRIVLIAMVFCLVISFASFVYLPTNQDKAIQTLTCDCQRDCPNQILNQKQTFQDSGFRKESNGKKTHKLSVVVPFRDRFDELLQFVPYMKKFLAAQGVANEILVINQADHHRFNRAALINAGFLLSSDDCDYIAMHDVDLLPLNPQLSYDFPSNGLFHVAAPGLHPLYSYKTFVGGILLVSKRVFKAVNGLSNLFWGWGREDDDFYLRLKAAGIAVARPPVKEMSTGKRNTFQHVHGPNRRRDQIRYDKQKLLSRQMDVLTGVNNVSFNLTKTQDLSIDGATAKIFHLSLECDYDATPWCDHLLSEEEIAAILARQKKERLKRRSQKPQN